VFQQLQGQIHIEEGDIKDDYISITVYSTSFTSFMSLKVKCFSLSERLTLPTLKYISVLGR
jgi:hypothetical protein